MPSLSGLGLDHVRFSRSTAVRFVGGLAALLAVVYVIVAYQFSQSLNRQEQALPTPPVGGVAVNIVQTTVNPTEPVVSALVIVDAHGSLKDQAGEFRTNILVSLSPSLQGEALSYARGTFAKAFNIQMPLVGKVQKYPLDTYTAAYEVKAFLSEDDGVLIPLPVEVSISVRDPGWRSETEVEDLKLVGEVTQTIYRAGSTISISFLLLSLIVALGVIASTVAIFVVVGRIEPGIPVGSWLAALLFSLVPIRNSLPGSPPPGAWIDILVFFWVEVAVMLAMVISVATLLIRVSRKESADGAATAEEVVQRLEQDKVGKAVVEAIREEGEENASVSTR